MPALFSVRNLTVVCAVVGLGTAVSWLTTADTKPRRLASSNKPSTTSSANTVKRPRPRVDRPHPGSIGSPRHRTAAAHVLHRERPQPPATAPLAVHGTAQDTQLPEPTDEERHELERRLADRLATEARDRDWADALEREFTTATETFAGAMGASLSHADCGQSLCALHIDYDTDDSRQRVAPLLSAIATVNHSDTFIARGDEGRSIVYLPRRGAELFSADREQM